MKTRIKDTDRWIVMFGSKVYATFPTWVKADQYIRGRNRIRRETLRRHSPTLDWFLGPFDRRGEVPLL